MIETTWEALGTRANRATRPKTTKLVVKAGYALQLSTTSTTSHARFSFKSQSHSSDTCGGRYLSGVPTSARTMKQEEVWKPIPNYEGLYEVSNRGRVRSLDRIIETRRGHKRPYQGQIMALTTETGRPQIIILSKNGDRKGEKVAEMVLEAFVRPREKNDTVLYRDRDPANAQLENLAWTCDLKG